MSTKERFKKGERESEVEFTGRIIDILSRTPEFRGLPSNIEKIIPHTDQNDLQDILLYLKMGKHHTTLSVELQQRTAQEFERYGQIVLDYISCYKPYRRYFRLDDFKEALSKGDITIVKRGKLMASSARILIFYSYDEFRNQIKDIFIYNLSALGKIRKNIERKGDFRTNKKSGGENWGSAFMAVDPDLIESCRIGSHRELMMLAFPQLYE